MNTDLSIRMAAEEDAEDILNIYSPYVTDTAISFEYEIPSVAEFSQRIINLNACVAYTAVEDAHLTNTSMFFHEHLGYSKVGHFTKCGYQFGTWYDMIWMEKIIGEHPDLPEPFLSITEIQV